MSEQPSPLGATAKRAGPSTRDRVLDAALDLFIEQGYDKASLRELAERMGFTKAALYYHFKSKSAILSALHLRMHGLLDIPMSILDGGPPSLENFEKFLDAFIEQIQANQKLFILHRVNQAALAQMHLQGHEGAHQELEDDAQRIFSDPSLSPDERLRMMAAFAVGFVVPMMAAFVAVEPVGSTEVVAVDQLKRLVHQVLRAE
ncbi:MAG TPA: TetR/AcrR family transcriptional regulator [Acidimicrobiales bacterium]|nr:TetR/AcrR family transcriptional regulator [Acidimicrobiales bacterium]